MSVTTLAAGELSLVERNLTLVVIAGVIALVALGFAAALVRAVLGTGTGTKNMQEIAGAVQEGATAYLVRQFKTLGIFVVIAVVVLYLLPVSEVTGSETSVKIGRSLFFIVGALLVVGALADRPAQGATLGASLGAVVGAAQGIDAVNRGYRVRAAYLPDGALHVRQL